MRRNHVIARIDFPVGRHRFAFTLIEVLVVVAIIALLVSILLPSLSRARDQAKLLTCQANSKQIATAQVEYQAENRFRVPILFNYWSYDPVYNAPARAFLQSVALRQYDKRTRNLSQITRGPASWGPYDPQRNWFTDAGNTRAKIEEYENYVIPDHYVCPFERGKGLHRETYNVEPPFEKYQWLGRWESYHTWLFSSIIKDNQIGGSSWPYYTTERLGTPRYSALPFNMKSEPGVSGGAALRTAHRTWKLGPSTMKKYKVASLSDVAVTWCAQGEHLQWYHSGVQGTTIGWANIGSHRTGQGGGTTLIFADGHVGWVKGTRVGFD